MGLIRIQVCGEKYGCILNFCSWGVELNMNFCIKIEVFFLLNVEDKFRF